MTILVAVVVVIETNWIRALIVVAALTVYQQVENNLLQPLVYKNTAKLSPVIVLCAVLIGAELAGIFGALVAIPAAGSLLAVGRELISYRSEVAASRIVPDGEPSSGTT